MSDNIQVMISPSGVSGKLIISGWFGIDRFSVSKISVTEQSKILRSLKRWICANDSAFQSTMIERLTGPFQYEHNRTGIEAGEFFGPIGTSIHLKVSLVGKHPVLQASLSPYLVDASKA